MKKLYRTVQGGSTAIDPPSWSPPPAMTKKSASEARFLASATALLSPDGPARPLRFRKHNSPRRSAQCEHLRSSDKNLARWILSPVLD